MPEWTFLTKHALVLILLAEHPRITGRELANALDVTERAIRKIITDLDEAGYIEKEKEGRRIRYRVNPDLPLRAEMHKDTAIGELLDVLVWERRPSRRRASRSVDVVK